MTAFTRKHALLLLLGPLGLAALYLAVVALIGWRVAGEVERYEALLVARDDVSVVQFDYAHDLWGGELTYRVIWRPARSAESVAELLRTLKLAEQRLTLTGKVDVRHGPWLGGFDLGLARLRVDVAPPEGMRDALPDYPGKTPLVVLKGTLGFTRNLLAEATLLNYDGELLDEGEDSTLQSYGVSAVLRANRALTAFEFIVDAPLFAVDYAAETTIALEQLRSVTELQRSDVGWQVASEFRVSNLDITNTQTPADGGGAVTLDDLVLAVDVERRANAPVLGTSTMDLAELHIDLPSTDMSIMFNDYRARGETRLVGDTVENSGTVSLRAFSVNERMLGGFVLETSLGGLQSATLAALDADWPSFGDEDLLAAWGNVVRTLAQEHVVLNVERLALQLPTEDDVTARLRVEYTGTPGVNIASPATVLAALEVEGSVQASVAAIEQTLVRAELDAEQQQSVEALLESLYAQPWVQVENGQLRSSVTVANSELKVNGETTDALQGWLALLDGTSPADTSTVSKTAVASGRCPDVSLVGAALTYTSDELFLTKTHKVVAGGSLDLAQCGAESISGFGYVEAAADFDLDYLHDPTNGDLEFRVDSQCDSVLLINDPQGIWYFDDDSNGNQDAKIRLGNPVSGNYDIWIGSLSAGGCSAQLTLESF
jgi:hypothetical protein